MADHPISEAFTSVQGEGVHAGRLCRFIRLRGCDYHCDWCDTKYAWGEVQPGTGIELAELKRAIPEWPRSVVFTGGNPLLYNLTPLLRDEMMYRHWVGVETQGSIYDKWLMMVDHITVSPKMPSSGCFEYTAYDWEPFVRELIAHRQDGQTAELKLVLDLTNRHEVGEPLHFVLFLWPAEWPVVLQPVRQLETGKCADPRAAMMDAYRELVTFAKAAEELRRFETVYVVPQLHQLAYPDARGI